MLAVCGAIIPVLAPNRDVRWLLTAGLFLAGAIYPLPDTHPKHFLITHFPQSRNA
jgi:hypothetical protein